MKTSANCKSIGTYEGPRLKQSDSELQYDLLSHDKPGHGL